METPLGTQSQGARYREEDQGEKEKGVGKLAPEIVNKVKVWKFGFCQKAWPDSIFVWCKSTREALLLIYFQLGSEEKLRDIIARTYD